jgi:hypothetical protein
VKRSEMIKIIKNALECWNEAYYDSSLEEHILDCIEEVGMQPPLIPWDDTISTFTEMHSWEDE